MIPGLSGYARPALRRRRLTGGGAAPVASVMASPAATFTPASAPLELWPRQVAGGLARSNTDHTELWINPKGQGTLRTLLDNGACSVYIDAANKLNYVLRSGGDHVTYHNLQSHATADLLTNKTLAGYTLQGGNDKRGLAIMVGWRASGVTPTRPTVTYGAATAEFVAEGIAFNAAASEGVYSGVFLVKEANLPGETGDIVVTVNEGSDVRGFIYAYTLHDLDQTTPAEDTANAIVTTSQNFMEGSLTTTVDYCLAMGFFVHDQYAWPGFGAYAGNKVHRDINTGVGGVNPRSSLQTQYLYVADTKVFGSRFASNFNPGAAAFVAWRPAGYTTVFHSRSTSAAYDDSLGWVNARMAVDLASGASYMQRNGADDETVVTAAVNQLVTHNGRRWFIGRDIDGENPYVGDMARLFKKTDAAPLDFSQQANKDKFVVSGAAARPADIGADGSTPYGATPQLYFLLDTTTGTTLRQNKADSDTETLFDYHELGRDWIFCDRTWVTPDNYLAAPPVYVNRTSLESDAGAAAQTRTHDDPNFPGANGTFTWSAVDPGGGNCVRYTDGSGGFWVRDGVPGTPDADNRIHIDWAEPHYGDDIGPLVTAVIDKYGTAYLKPPKDRRASICFFGDYGAGCSVFDIEDATHQHRAYSQAWDWGTLALHANDFSTTGGNIWTKTFTDPIARLFVDDRIDHITEANGAGGNQIAEFFRKPGWYCDRAKPVADVATVTTEGYQAWHHGANTLTMHAFSDPFKRYAGMRYLKTYGAEDRIGSFDNVGTVALRGSRDGFHFSGRAPRDSAPFANVNSGGTYSTGGEGTTVIALVFNISGAPFTNPGGSGSFYTSMPFANMWNVGLNINELARDNGYATLTFAKEANSSQLYGAVDVVLENAGLDDQGNFSDGKGAGSGRGGGVNYGDPTPTLERNFTNNNQSFIWYTVRGGSSFRSGQTFKGDAVGTRLPFVTFDSIGNGANDPLVLHYGMPGYTTAQSKTGRPYLDAQSNSAATFLGKVDGIANHQNAVHIKHVYHNPTYRLDIHGRPFDNKEVLDVPFDPDTYDYLGNRGGFNIEATGGFTQGNYFNCDWDIVIEGATVDDACIYSYGTEVASDGHGWPWDSTANHTYHVNGKFYGKIDLRLDSAMDVQANGDIRNSPTTDVAVEVGTDDWYYSLDPVADFGDRPFGTTRKLRVDRGCDLQVLNLTTTAALDPRIEMQCHGDDDFGVESVLDLDVSGMATGDKVVADAGKDETYAYVTDDGGLTYYGLPYEVGAANTSKDPPPSLRRISFAHAPFTAVGSRKAMCPPLIKAGDLMVITWLWDGSPGTVTPPAGWNILPGSSIINLADNSRYAAAYYKIAVLPADYHPYGDANFKGGHSFLWNGGNRSGSWHFNVYRGAHQTTPIINVGTQVDDLSDTAYVGDDINCGANNNALAVDMCIPDGDVEWTALAGGASPWVSRFLLGNTALDSTIGNILVTDVRAPTGGTVLGCDKTLSANAKKLGITFAIAPAA
ncbi:MAG: hypothetical protein MJE12_08340 [Alphaproteobacteria bacterium]|nr:hypothetical protein [Alphaproteobacteria bacterium]